MGAVTGHKARYVGGIAGRVGSDIGLETTKISQCFNAGAITGTTDCVHVGGIIGALEDVHPKYGIYDCYNTGKITAQDQESVIKGGIASHVGVGGDIHRCFHMGSNTKNVIYGRSDGSHHCENNYTNHKDNNGKGEVTYISTANFMDKSKFKGFDFEDMWTIDESLGHPVLIRNP